MLITLSAFKLFSVARIEQIVRVLDLCKILLLDELGYRIRDWFRNELESMLPLVLLRVVVAPMFIEMAIDLLDLGNLPAKMLLCLSQSVRSVARMHVSIAFQSNFPGIAVELFSNALLGFCIVIS